MRQNAVRGIGLVAGVFLVIGGAPGPAAAQDRPECGTFDGAGVAQRGQFRLQNVEGVGDPSNVTIRVHRGADGHEVRVDLEIVECELATAEGLISEFIPEGAPEDALLLGGLVQATIALLDATHVRVTLTIDLPDRVREEQVQGRLVVRGPGLLVAVASLTRS